MSGEVKAQSRVQIYEGMSVETVQKKGSNGQKLMAPLFDDNGDGVYSKSEAEIFNKYNFKTEKGKITLFRNEDDGTQDVTVIKYDNYEEDVLHAYQGKALNRLWSFLFKNDKGRSCYLGGLPRGNVAIDMIKGTAQINGAVGNHICAADIELTIKDSDLKEVNIKNCKLNLQNTKDVGVFWDSATEVHTDGKSVINADKDSKIEVIVDKNETKKAK